MTARNVAKALPWPKTVGPSEHPPFLTDDRRACKDKPIEYFYPETEPTRMIALGRRVCRGCPFEHLRGDGSCLRYALRNEPFGLWSGLTEMQRFEMGGVGNGRTNTPGVAA